MDIAGYSDRIQHALAFAAKHVPAPRSMHRVVPSSPALAGTGVALLLASHGADEATLVATILRPSVQRPQGQLERIPAKFGPEVGELLRALAPLPLGWAVGAGGPEARRRALGLAAVESGRPPLVMLGEAVHSCGVWAATARRLGPEYTHDIPLVREEALDWYVRLAEAFGRGAAASRDGLIRDLRWLGADLVRSLPRAEG
ncbi:MAG TPA: HD domain-containing protein [Gemmatimonadales bacterium]|jgi:(p)ppGpp synthase/HD superfamily hydrolase|nr:HD domain-containing protein [Gemmatimonadales bacterium]